MYNGMSSSRWHSCLDMSRWRANNGVFVPDHSDVTSQMRISSGLELPPRPNPRWQTPKLLNADFLRYVKAFSRVSD